MKFHIHHQRRRQREAAPSVSLFPFLAVLICTMGALVPLLFAITRQARLQAAQTAAAKIAEKKGELQSECEMAEWRIEQLHISREKTDAQISDARLELGHLEDHARRLRGDVAQLKQTVTDLDKLGNEDDRQYAEQASELEKLRVRIGMARQEVADARTEALKRNKTYAVVPYEGPNQTHRRPIYLECRADAVVLQPEGIYFVEADFEGPMGPGNPLASALRATREYLLNKKDFDPQRDGEPYPLLLVRPDGIAAYYAARGALQSWAMEFGYELVDADWKLAYPPPDQQLADIVREVIAAARVRQERLIAAAPSAYAKKSHETYHATPTRGGFVREGGSDYDEGDEQEHSGFQPRPYSGRIGGRRGSSENAGDIGASTGLTEAQQIAALYGNAGGDLGSNAPGSIGPAGAARSSGGGAFTGTSGGGTISGASGQSTTPGAYGTGSGMNAGSGLAGADVAGGYNSGGDIPGGTTNVSSINSGGGNIGNGNLGGGVANSSGVSSYAANGNVPGGDIIGDDLVGGSYPGNGQGNVLRDATTVSAGTNGMRDIGAVGDNRAGDSGQWAVGSGQQIADRGQQTGSGEQGTAQTRSGGSIKLPEGYVVGQPQKEQPELEPSSRAIDQESTVKHATPLRPGEWQPHERPPLEKPFDEKMDDKKNDKHSRGKSPKGLAEKRGRDWGLPDAAGGSVPITRPIKIECRPDQLVILPEERSSGAKSVPLGTRTSGSIESFISAIWEHMNTWGIAGRGMYWRPVLKVYVAPGAEQRFADLQMLLEGSGLKIERK